jgi:prepilin-type N-terminal cleavage/methylation domain-containing protein
MGLAGRVRAFLAREGGYSLPELLVVTAILGVVLGSLTTVFVTASHGELDMNRRFQAQEQARLALDKLRREIHCATAVSPSGNSSSITLTMPSQCPTAGGATTVRWCVLTLNADTGARLALYRSTAATCTAATGVKWADYLRSASIFTYTVQSSSSLGSLAVALVVNTRTNLTVGTFRLSDTIVLRNSSRTCIAGSPSPPC